MKSKISIAIALMLAILSAGSWFRWGAGGSPEIRHAYRLGTVSRRDLRVVISATGTLEPEEIVDIGAQVAGKISEFGLDPETGGPLDYGSTVTTGMLLARIDDSLAQQELNVTRAQLTRARALEAQCRAQVQEGEAGVARAEAELGQTNTNLDKAERDWSRRKALSNQGATTEAERDRDQAAIEAARASKRISEASVLQAQAALLSRRAAVDAAAADVENAEAALKRAETTLGYCTIVSPIDGTIVDRRVNIGQTVVSSLNTPSLFLIAKDLRRLQIWVQVNEADMGQIRKGMPVRFTVDAFPDQQFTGAVTQIRLNASMSQNVVTYTVVATVDNRDSQLLPYMTANVDFLVEERPQTLCLPAAALRFAPGPDDRVLAESRPGRGPGPASAGTIPAQPGPSSHELSSSEGTVWVLAGDRVKSVSVRTGVSDGQWTELLAGDLAENAAVVTGREEGEVTTAANPFVPRVGNRRPEQPR